MNSDKNCENRVEDQKDVWQNATECNQLEEDEMMKGHACDEMIQEVSESILEQEEEDVAEEHGGVLEGTVLCKLDDPSAVKEVVLLDDHKGQEDLAYEETSNSYHDDHRVAVVVEVAVDHH